MRIAFYAPLKPPDHPVPSGDRRVAGLLLDALQLAGHQPFVVSRLRSYDRSGDPDRQSRLAEVAAAIAKRLLRRWHRDPAAAPDLWFTYHLYYKAPDWLGPAISAALDIPYVIAEASSAPRRARGPWRIGQHGAEQALRRADAVLGLNPADRDGVEKLLRDTDRWVPFPPFLDARKYSGAARTRPSSSPRLTTVAMMRRGDKLASYRLLAHSLTMLSDLDWSLDVVGDGEARGEIAAAFAAFGSRVRWCGALDDNAVASALADTDLFVWPAINEAFGMALLEAQASGLPVVAGESGGVGGIVADRETGFLVRPGDPVAFAAALRRLILDPDRRAAMGAAARARVLREHDLPAAAARLRAMLAGLRARTAA
ncbi:MAG: glycosyltransferase family 4 protein [Alphaproteobacteria bacterium]